jgi:hypothetical protein
MQLPLLVDALQVALQEIDLQRLQALADSLSGEKIVALLGKWLRRLAYNLGNLWRRLVLPNRRLQQRLVNTSGRLVKHAGIIGCFWRRAT